MTVIVLAVQVTLPRQTEPQGVYSTTLFGSGPNFRMIVTFGGNETFLGKPTSTTSLLHLGKYIYPTTHARTFT